MFLHVENLYIQVERWTTTFHRELILPFIVQQEVLRQIRYEKIYDLLAQQDTLKMELMTTKDRLLIDPSTWSFDCKPFFLMQLNDPFNKEIKIRNWSYSSNHLNASYEQVFPVYQDNTWNIYIYMYISDWQLVVSFHWSVSFLFNISNKKLIQASSVREHAFSTTHSRAKSVVFIRNKDAGKWNGFVFGFISVYSVQSEQLVRAGSASGAVYREPNKESKPTRFWTLSTAEVITTRLKKLVNVLASSWIKTDNFIRDRFVNRLV